MNLSDVWNAENQTCGLYGRISYDRKDYEASFDRIGGVEIYDGFPPSVRS